MRDLQTFWQSEKNAIASRGGERKPPDPRTVFVPNERDLTGSDAAFFVRSRLFAGAELERLHY